MFKSKRLISILKIQVQKLFDRKHFKMMGMDTSSYGILVKCFQSKHLQNAVNKCHLNILYILLITHFMMNV